MSIDAVMIAPTRPAIARAGVVLVTAVLTLAMAGCASRSEPSPPTPTVSATQTAATSGPPVSTPLPSSPSPATSAEPGLTETDWGPIWDALPPGFPRYPGSTPTETGGGAASATFDVPADVQTATTWLQGELERAGFSTFTLSGPAEDGSMEIESVGPATQCRVRTMIAPLGGSTIVTVLYGAYCPAT